MTQLDAALVILMVIAVWVGTAVLLLTAWDITVRLLRRHDNFNNRPQDHP